MKVQSSRAKARLKIEFKDVESFVDEYTYNISKGGVFLRTPELFNLRDIVEIGLIIPEEQTEVITLGEVVQVVSAEMATSEMPAGMGIHLLELKKDDREKIEGFVNARLREKTQHPAKREDRRIDARILVKFESEDHLIEEYANNISRGGIFISTPDLRPVGEQIEIILIHPAHGQELLLRGEVVHVVSEEDTKKFKIQTGMGIKFKDLNPYVMFQIEEFINSETIKDAGKGLIIKELQVLCNP